MTWFNRLAASVVVVSMCAASCTKAVDVPHDQFEAAARDEGVSHRIMMHDGSNYVARRFAVTDSTIVILERPHSVDIHTSDKVPVTLRREDVKAIDRLELDRGPSFFLTAGLFMLAMLVIGIATIDIH